MSIKEATKETFGFKAEIKQLLDILVHSLYTSREIFLRELISNASDALDKIRFELTKGSEFEDKELPLEIKLTFDEKKKILTVSDTGIGMTKDEIISNIGTIAKSGTGEFLKQLSENKNDANNLIGKFGVGFYSVFMVAEKVTITTKSFLKDAQPVKWESDGSGEFTIVNLDDKISRGTSIEIILKDDAKEYADKYTLERIVKKHSNFITFPILVDKEKVNNVTALWREPKSNIKKEQYNDFYKFLTYDNDEPADIIHVSIDAPIQFNSLLFIPKKNMDMFGYQRENYGLDLYVRRVLIQHKNKDLLPEYLGFVKGVVDSEDLPLNVSRETLQENIIFTKISQSVTNQILNHLIKKAKDEPEKYSEFWIEHGKFFKLGYSDFTNHEKFSQLLRFNSSHAVDEKTLVSFEDYILRFKDGQKEIYYYTGNSREAISSDPHVEIFKKKGIEVLYLLDPIDEFVIESLRKYKDFDFVSAEKADLKKLDKFEDSESKKEDEQPLSKDDEKHFDSLLSKMKSILGDKVTDVKESKRLNDSPVCLVSPEDGLSSHMQRILNMTGKEMSVPKKIMEINKNHLLIRNLLELFKKNGEDEFVKNATEQLFESSLLTEGFLQDPHKLVARLQSTLTEVSKYKI